jgi:hypothetical protein
MKGSGDFSIGSTFWPGISKLVEEMGELNQVIGRLLATAGEVKHWDDPDLRLSLERKVADVMAAIAFVTMQNHLNEEVIDERVRRKYALFSEWQENRPGECTCVTGGHRDQCPIHGEETRR